ncbi:MAG TPA: 3-isopropylmalate dehydratase small subunit [Candidatus Sulfotelmatobacter sp.]|nr:3-isopropylmalate dehydratase small subunit [Candidatus Sulfotelmatobacter sp.]
MIVEGTVLAIPRANIDTDQIIPAHYLTRIDEAGMGEHLFEGLPDGAHYLTTHPTATILVTGENFGCGSSREHAAWALKDRGFRAVIAPSFARIFHENAYNNGVVPVILPPETVEGLLGATRIAIDVQNERLRADGGTPIPFQLDPLRKQFVLGGGFLAYLATKIPQVRAWEAARG